MNKRLPSGDAFMSDGDYPRLLKMLKYEKDARLLKRIQAAVLRKRGKTIRQMAKIVQMSYGTICNWLHALQERGMDALYWKKPPRCQADSGCREA